MSAPSTDWQEVIPPGEAAELEALAEQFRAIHLRLKAKEGPGRAFHLVGVQTLHGELEVLPDLPAYAAQGIFSRPARYPAVIRLSNGAFERQPDRRPDIRGYAISVEGIEGTSVLTGGPATSQDFLLINREVFGVRTIAQFIAMVDALTRGPLATLWWFFREFGPIGMWGELRRIVDGMKRPFSGFFSESFCSAAPIRWGAYAAQVRLSPAVAPGPKVERWQDDVTRALAAGQVVHELQAQFFTDEAHTPIEDAMRAWDAPWVTVARLTVLPGDAALAAAVEQRKFDPYNAVIEHQPLGFAMRARKVMYYVSQQVRGVA